MGNRGGDHLIEVVFQFNFFVLDDWGQILDHNYDVLGVLEKNGVGCQPYNYLVVFLLGLVLGIWLSIYLEQISF
jgi:hypothetical protein